MEIVAIINKKSKANRIVQPNLFDPNIHLPQQQPSFDLTEIPVESLVSRFQVRDSRLQHNSKARLLMSRQFYRWILHAFLPV